LHFRVEVIISQSDLTANTKVTMSQSERAKVSSMDVRKLMQEPSGKTRGMLAGKIALDYRNGGFSANEMNVANDIFRILLKDIEKKVRVAIAEHLAHAPNVPRDILLQMVTDDFDVAVYPLEFSRVLNDQDLLEIVKSSEEIERLRAIARRENLSVDVATGLTETQNVSVLTDLFANKTAIITDNALLDTWQQIATNEPLAKLLVDRGGLSLTIVEKLLSAVSEDLKHRLMKEYKVSAPMAHKAAADVREWEMLGLVAANSNFDPEDNDQVDDLVTQMSLNGRLTHSILIRSLCMGSINLFEAGLARMAGVPRVNARLLLSDASGMGFHAIYSASNMPVAFEAAIRVLLKICVEESNYGFQVPTEFKKHVVDRIYRSGYHRSIDNMEYLLSIIGGKIENL
jgi:uncharacterized protein (DUF2336 family)